MKTQIALMAVAAVSLMAMYGCAELGLTLEGPQETSIADLRCEYLVDPLGIDTAQPRLSWKVNARRGARGQGQTAYQVLVASSPEKLAPATADLWDSGKVQSDASIHVVYGGKALESRTACWWKVRLWDENGAATAWSKPAKWSMGLLKPGDWTAKWIGLDEVQAAGQQVGDLAKAHWIWFPEGRPEQSAPVGNRHFRRTISIPQGRVIRKATCQLTADNSFELSINGKSVGTGSNFTQLGVFDIASNLRTGNNIISVAAGNVGDAPNPAGLIGMIRIEFAQGAPMVILTDKSWQVAERPNAQAWATAQELGLYGIGPWGNISVDDRTRLAARMLRRQFAVDGTVRRATAYVCGLGLFEMHLNGRKIGDHVLSPGLTEYDKRSFYVTFDVTGQIRNGDNAVGVWLGNGRYFAPRSKVPTATRTFGYPKLLLQMEIEYADGRMQRIVSDGSWKLTTHGPILANNEYDGEEYDARLEMPGWAQSGFDDSKWQAAQLVRAASPVLSAQMMEPIRVIETIKPVKITEPQPGMFIFDMGQNMVGWCRLNVSGPKGSQVTLRHAEVLKPDGTLYLDNIRSANVTDIYTLKGDGQEVWEPRFTYHGFRFVEMRGYPGKPTLESIEGRVVHDDVKPAGQFACSNDLLNQIHRNIVWGVRGNYRSFPTDCPQRDERQAWLGDRSAESRGETYLHDVAALYAKWMQDIEDAQKDNGSIPDVAPSYWPLYNDDVTWPSSYIIIPGAILDQYGDTELIARRYATMKKWINHMRQYIKDDLMPKDTYGDWCVPPENPKLIHSNDPARKTSGQLLATAYFYHDLKLMARYATILGKADDARQFDTLAERMKAAFNRRYLKPELGQYDNGSQTSCVLPLAFDMVPPRHKQAVFNHLIKKITEESRNHIGTGLIGGQWLMRVLSDNGRADLAYTIAGQKTYPSWGYMISKGATTIWELWNGDTADPAMNSGNHVMLVGDLGIWMHEYIAGIRPDPATPGFKRIIIRPYPVGDLTSAQATHRSPYGQISSAWGVEGDRFALNVTIPPNTKALVEIPTTKPDSVTESGKPAGQASGVKFIEAKDGRAIYQVGSGKYSFAAPR